MAINEDIPGISDLFETMEAGTNQAPLERAQFPNLTRILSIRVERRYYPDPAMSMKQYKQLFGVFFPCVKVDKAGPRGEAYPVRIPETQARSS